VILIQLTIGYMGRSLGLLQDRDLADLR